MKPHTHIIQYFGVCADPEYPICIIMEYMPLGTVLDFIVQQRKLTTLKMVIEFGMDIASGMQHIHAQNMLHLDLAARNLLLFHVGDRLGVKVADFGLAKRTDGGTYNIKADASIPISKLFRN